MTEIRNAMVTSSGRREWAQRFCYRREFWIPILVKLDGGPNSADVDEAAHWTDNRNVVGSEVETPNSEHIIQTIKLEKLRVFNHCKRWKSIVITNHPIALRCFLKENKNERSAGVEKNQTSTVQQFRRFLQRDIRIATYTRLMFFFFMLVYFVLAALIPYFYLLTTFIIVVARRKCSASAYFQTDHFVDFLLFFSYTASTFTLWE